MEEKTCPDCGKPMGELTVCPSCGADLTKRTTHKFALIICIAALVAGLVYYYTAVVTGEYLIKIGDIDEDYNYAYVWIEGTVSSGPLYRIYPSVRLDFWVDDGTGEIRVRAYSDKAENLAVGDKVPGIGDYVKLFGWVRVEEYGTRIDLQTVEKFELIRRPARDSTIHDVISNYPDSMYDVVTVEGTVVNFSSLSVGAADLYTLKDEETGELIQMYVHAGLDHLGGERPDMSLMTKLRVTAGVSEYRRDRSCQQLARNVNFVYNTDNVNIQGFVI